MITEHYFIRNIHFDELLEKFFISAILAILGIRLFLHLTGYPQLGGGGLHIAHMLWGGLLMLAAIVLLLTSLNRSTIHLAAVLGGLGFGTFIDELGKFITSDNNYFYKPTVALIYIVFILLFLCFRALRHYSSFSPSEYLVNSIELVKEAVINKLTGKDKERVLDYLSKSDQNSEITQSLEKLCPQLGVVSVPKPGIFTRLRPFLEELYIRLLERKGFIRAVVIFFVLEAILSFLLIAWLIFWLHRGFASPFAISELQKLSLPDIMSLISSAIAGVFAIWGTLKIRRSRLAAYELFRKSMLVSIFLVQVFSFYKNQMQAFFGLLFNILILITLNYMIEGEKALADKS